MAMQKKFDFGVGIYYFNIRTSGQSSITIKRKLRAEALRAFNEYKHIGKDVEWLGKWEGKKFSDTTP